MLILYSTIVWAAFLLYSFFTLHNHDDVDTETKLLTLAPVFLIPFGIYSIRRFLKWFYTRKQNYEESNLKTLRAQQRLKVEELKKKTSYYTTKSLLERYDPAAAEAARRQQQQKQQNEANRQHSDLRQRKQPQGRPMPTMPHQQRPSFPAPQPPRPQERQWYDKLVDALIGEEGPETKYALICKHCYAHNGLALPQEIQSIQYTCPNCKQFNGPRGVAKPSQQLTLSPTPEHSKPVRVPSPSSSSGGNAGDDEQSDSHHNDARQMEETAVSSEEDSDKKKNHAQPTIEAF
ncbi:hypothetical protein BCR43DRAFT_439970 [Syncephalastrum racemosum]|uniref:Endoplasmic reticulum junction formation protein lunapark n=1 Tax=Syncephalastrum racemosum TaxID=13706 RepID=A0A1X2HCT7_SYNRA|nr:hypothetical protein BCR43DRAFT_439970 [Syncephalastrum racemosum]